MTAVPSALFSCCSQQVELCSEELQFHLRVMSVSQGLIMMKPFSSLILFIYLFFLAVTLPELIKHSAVLALCVKQRSLVHSYSSVCECRAPGFLGFAVSCLIFLLNFKQDHIHVDYLPKRQDFPCET